MTLTVSDIKQYIYCPRIVYFTYCMPVEKKVTAKMEFGREEHEEIEFLERRRKLSRYGLSQGQRKFHLRLNSERLGLSGTLDMLIVSDGEYIPVEFKYSSNPPGLNHKYQLTAYAMLVEDQFERSVRRGFIYVMGEERKDICQVEITPNMRRFVRKAMGSIREMVLSERMPEGTRYQSRCTDCEFINFCGDRR